MFASAVFGLVVLPAPVGKSFSEHQSGTCSHHGGAAEWYR
jgi:hypothetical protein